MIKVYIASKLKYAPQFRILRREWGKEEIDLHARWFDQASLEEESSPDDFKIFWRVDEEDVRASHALIIYGEAGDILRGALVEAGLAIAYRKLILIVGEADFGTWQHHPACVRATSMKHAKQMILRRFRVGDTS